MSLNNNQKYHLPLVYQELLCLCCLNFYMSLYQSHEVNNDAILGKRHTSSIPKLSYAAYSLGKFGHFFY